MNSTADFRMQPQEVTDATNQLDALASRAEKLMQTEAPNLTVTAAARDEVSQRVASTLNDVHSQFSKSADQAKAEIRRMAASLRAHTDNVVAAEEDFAV
ncbi:PE family protein [Mycobacterium sp. Aquia_216]|uniref:PE family protein n=1 Tax=Mycobacterium sp. Aquia_216 TaxID=2991729 RepID=UPI00227B0F33|nr:PE family protein [Mycobacterium sp. Aquia_216]WAJ46361.1 PE family protein [Mycobacterium sp. Aquia_216]